MQSRLQTGTSNDATSEVLPLQHPHACLGEGKQSEAVATLSARLLIPLIVAFSSARRGCGGTIYLYLLTVMQVCSDVQMDVPPAFAEHIVETTGVGQE